MIQCDPPVTPRSAQADPRAAPALQLADELAKERVIEIAGSPHAVR
jgi:hypothetical protein